MECPEHVRVQRLVKGVIGGDSLRERDERSQLLLEAARQFGPPSSLGSRDRVDIECPSERRISLEGSTQLRQLKVGQGLSGSPFAN